MTDLESLGRIQKAFLTLFFSLLLLLLVLALAEGALRIRSYLKTGQWWGVEETYELDRATDLRVPKPGYSAGGISINSRGFRGPEVPVPKPDGIIRLAFLGGSTTYCAEVSSNEAVWAHLVTSGLSEKYPAHQFDYVNGGVPGYGLSTSLRNLQLRVAETEPDVIVIYHATNDLSANSFDAAREAGVAERHPDKDRWWTSKYSLLSHLVEINLEILWLTSSDDLSKLEADVEALTVPFRQDLDRLLESAKLSSKLVAVATFSTQYRRDQPTATQNRAAATSLYYMPYMTVPALIDSFDSYNAAIRSSARANRALLIGGEHEIPGDMRHFNDSVHLTDAGSAAMASRVVKALVASEEFTRLLETSRARRDGQIDDPT